MEVRDRYHATARASVTLTVTSGSQPALSINDVAIAEGNSGTAILGFTVSLSAVSWLTVLLARHRRRHRHAGRRRLRDRQGEGDHRPGETTPR